MAELTTVAQVIEVFGGVTATGEILRRKYPRQTAQWWKNKNKFPPASYCVMQRKLKQLGHTAPPSLWGMIECER